MNNDGYLTEPIDAVKVLITSSRDVTPKMMAKIKRIVKMCIKKNYWVIVGDAEGGDAEVIRLTNLYKSFRVTVWGAKGYLKRGTACGINHVTYAGYLQRDDIMAAQCDACIAVWNGFSKGTIFTAEAAKGFGKQVKVYNFGKDYKRENDKFNREGGGRTSGVDEYVKPDIKP